MKGFDYSTKYSALVENKYLSRYRSPGYSWTACLKVMIKLCFILPFPWLNNVMWSHTTWIFDPHKKTKKNNPMTIYASSQFNLFLVHFCLYLIKSRIKHHSYHFYGLVNDLIFLKFFRWFKCYSSNHI
jgi:hypothetical protein